MQSCTVPALIYTSFNHYILSEKVKAFALWRNGWVDDIACHAPDITIWFYLFGFISFVLCYNKLILFLVCKYVNIFMPFQTVMNVKYWKICMWTFLEQFVYEMLLPHCSSWPCDFICVSEFVQHCIQKILSMYKKSDHPPTSVLLVGHSLVRLCSQLDLLLKFLWIAIE